MPQAARRQPMKQEQKITLGEMRATGLRRLLVYCGDYKCAHHVEISAEQWPDHVRLPLFVCQACGHRGADVRPLFNRERMPERLRDRAAELRQ
jgi:hypothetical protein